MTPPTRSSRTLAVHPTTKGFGWVIFEGPLSPYDWGFVIANGDKNAVCLEKVEQLLSKCSPETLILEAFEKGVSHRSERIAALCRTLMALAVRRGMDSVVYTRQDVRSCFESVGARTRHQIARVISCHIDVLELKLPNPRKQWDGEDHRMAIFSSVALVLTHYKFGANRLFDDLLDNVQSS